MLDELLLQVRATEEEARKIAARGNKEAERILGRIKALRETESKKAIDEVKQLMEQLEKIKLEEARATADRIREEGEREIGEIKESVKPKIKRITEEIRDIISQG